MQAFLCFIYVFVQSFRYEFSYHVLLGNTVVYGESMRCWQVSCQGFSGCCYTIGLDTCACPGYCYSKNITPFMVSQLLTAHRNNKPYTSLFLGVTLWRLRDMSRRFGARFASNFRKICGEESISEVRIPIRKVYPIALVIIRMVISRGGWYSSHSQCLVFFKDSSTLMCEVGCHWIYITPTHGMHQWLLLQYLVLLMMDADSVRTCRVISCSD